MKVIFAFSFLQRLKGLIGQSCIETPLLIAPCHAIHMLFMKVDIDAVFIDQTFRIKKIYRGLKRWRGLAFCFDAWGVIEMKAGEANRLNLKIGDTLYIEG